MGATPQNHDPGSHAVQAASPVTGPRSLFISGHSLTARPFGDFLEGLARADGGALDWNMQHLVGSSIKARTRGSDGGAWSGYRAGEDRHGNPVNALHALAAGAGGKPYDALILTELHSLLESLIWHDSIGHGLDYEARFAATNPRGRTYLYASWLQIDDPDRPARWLAYERSAGDVWDCTVARMNMLLAERGIDRRISLIPAAQGLAALVERACSEQGLPGVSAVTCRDTLAVLFTDDVHLTAAGAYYVALLSHDVLHGSPPRQAWSPEGIGPDLATALRDSAAAFMAQWRSRPEKASDACSGEIMQDYVPVYLAYVRDNGWRSAGWFRAHIRWIRYSIVWPRLLRRDRADNPFRPLPLGSV